MINVSERLKRYMFDSKINSLKNIISVLKLDIMSLLSEYMEVASEPLVLADIDDKSGQITLNITVKSNEIYQSGRLVE